MGTGAEHTIIGTNAIREYERWQAELRAKQSQAPTTNIGHDDYIKDKWAKEAALNVPAFPINEHDSLGDHYQTHLGITTRDYFAAKAMQAIITKLPVVGRESEFGKPVLNKEKYNADIADSSYWIADAMLAARTK